MRKEATSLYCLVSFALSLLLVSCQRDTGREVITYCGESGQAWVMDSDGTNKHQFPLEDRACGLEWSPDGRRVAFGSYDDQGYAVWVANSDGSEPHPVTNPYDEMGLHTWLNDNILLIWVAPDPADRYSVSHYALDLQDGSMQQYSTDIERVVPFPTGDRWITSNSGDYGMILHGLDQDPQSLFPSFGVTSFDVSPSGQEIVFCGTDYSADGTEVTGIYRWEVDSSIKPALVHSLDFYIDSVHWSPDGRYIGFITLDETLRILDANTNKVRYEHEIAPLVGSQFIWSPSSNAVLVMRHYGERGPGPKELASVDIQTGNITRLTECKDMETAVSWVIIR